MNSKINIQDSFLNQIRREKINATIYLVNGFQLNGKVMGFDNFTVLLETDGQQQMIYKHAISTITPQKSIKNLFNNNDCENKN
jgi:host factor-I protein